MVPGERGGGFGGEVLHLCFRSRTSDSPSGDPSLLRRVDVPRTTLRVLPDVEAVQEREVGRVRVTMRTSLTIGISPPSLD